MESSGRSVLCSQMGTDYPETVPFSTLRFAHRIGRMYHVTHPGQWDLMLPSLSPFFFSE